jgi:urate oxidase
MLRVLIRVVRSYISATKTNNELLMAADTQRRLERCNARLTYEAYTINEASNVLDSQFLDTSRCLGTTSAEFTSTSRFNNVMFSQMNATVAVLMAQETCLRVHTGRPSPE